MLLEVKRGQNLVNVRIELPKSDIIPEWQSPPPPRRFVILVLVRFGSGGIGNHYTVDDVPGMKLNSFDQSGLSKTT